MPLQVPIDASGVILHVALLDAAGDRIANVAHNAAGLAFAYRVENQSTWTSVTLIDGTVGTWASGSWKHDGNGMYQIGLPNAAIVANRRTFLRLTLGSVAPQFDSIEATGVPANTLNAVQNAGAGQGDYICVVEVESDSNAIPGATVTIQTEAGQIVRWGRTGSGGSISFNLDEGTYVVLVSAGSGFVDFEDTVLIEENETLAVVLEANEEAVAAIPADTASGAVYKLYTAVDWILDLNVGTIPSGWEELRFTMKSSLIDDDDNEAVVQVKVTNGGDASDGLIVLNAQVDAEAIAPSEGNPGSPEVVIQNDWASIEVLDLSTGDIRVTLTAAATDAAAPTDERLWRATDEELATIPIWRRNLAQRPIPPWYHFDVKRLDGNNRAAPITARGKIIAIEAVTQTVVD